MRRREFLGMLSAGAAALGWKRPGRIRRGHVDARERPNGSLIESDRCIVGAGAAGITMAMEWIGSGRDVVLLEGGGFDIDAQMQDLYAGNIVGQPYYPLFAAR